MLTANTTQTHERIDQQTDKQNGAGETKPAEKLEPKVTYILLVRHGENDWVKSNRLAGRTPGVNLNEKGNQQSAELATLLAKQPLQAIYSSPLERCLQTAQPLADTLGLAITPELGVIEVDYGEWRGAELKELSKLPAWHLVQHYPSSFRFPSGETLYEVQARAVHTLETIRQQQVGKTVAVFSHGDVIRLSLAHYLGVPIDLFQRVHISTASVSIVAFHESVPSVLGMNLLTSLPIFEHKPPPKEPAIAEDKSQENPKE